MAFTKEQRIINSVSGSTKKSRNEKKETNLTGSFNIPNKSGDHVRSIKREAPVNSYDLVNKQYVDDQIATAEFIKKQEDGQTGFVDSEFTGGGGVRLNFGQTTDEDEFMEIGSFGAANNINTKARTFKIFSTANADIFEINPTTAVSKFYGDVDLNSNDIIGLDDIQMSSSIMTITDSDNNNVLRIGDVPNAVNNLFISDAAAGGHPEITSEGSDTNPNVRISPKGSGALDVATSKIINVVDPTADQDAATKKYVDDHVPNKFHVDKLIRAPDKINDKIPIFYVNDKDFPNGATVKHVSITLPSDTAYTMPFEEWSGDPPTEDAVIETVTTGATDAYKEVEDGDIDNPNLEANDYIFLDIPSTDVDWIFVKIILERDDS